MAVDKNEYQRKFKAIQEGFVAELPAKLTQIEQHSRALDDNWDATRAQELYLIVHRLAGTGETFGFPQLSRSARELDELLAAHSQAHPPGPSERAALARATATLTELLQALIRSRG